MVEELKSEGKCLYCKQMFTQKEIGKHLAKHLSEMEKTNTEKNLKTYCHIEVEAQEMFLHLLVKGAAKMEIIDEFLRAIWLECCGHMSCFMQKNDEIGMNQKVEKVFEPKVKIFHDYDFGTTTRVLLKGLKKYNLNLKENIILLSRNEPLKVMCGVCKKKPAVNMCTTCIYDEYAFYCETCSKKHEKTCDDFADYSSMPVVNSPRMGECGYTGGSIDLERDGTYKKMK